MASCKQKKQHCDLNADITTQERNKEITALLREKERLSVERLQARIKELEEQVANLAKSKTCKT